MIEPTNAPTPPTNRDAANWARPVDRLSAAGVAGAKDDAVTGKRVSGPLQGFGQLWQKSFTVRLDGVDTTPEARHRRLEGALPRVLAEGRNVLCAAVRASPRARSRSSRSQPVPGRPGQALDRRPGPLRGRRVVHVHDPRGPYAVGMDHLLGAARRRRGRRPGPGPRATVRPVRRARLHARRQPPEQQVLAGDPAQPRRSRSASSSRSSRSRSSASTSNRQWRHWRNVRNSATLRSARRTLTSPVRRITRRG